MDNTYINEIIGALTVLIVLWIYPSYIIQSLKGKISPHPLSWIIWTIIMGVVVAAQISDNAGPGVWANALVFFSNIAIALISFKNGFSNISRLDKISFILALSSIPIWIMTDNALYAVILVCLINIFAFIPTFRKSWMQPHEEALDVFSLNCLRHLLSIAALANYSLITTLAPITFFLSNAILALFLLWRRYTLKHQ